MSFCYSLTIVAPIEKTDTFITSKLSSLDTISPKEIYTEHTSGVSYHYYLIKTKNELSAKEDLILIPKGFEILDKKIYVIVSEKVVIDYETYEVENCTYADEYYEKRICFQYNETKTIRAKEYILSEEVGLLTKDGDQKVLMIKTPQWAKGSFNSDVSACGTLSDANEVYTLTDDVTEEGATCFTVDAQNITLDCAGFSITGDNSSTTYGVYSDEFNTTVENCIIQNFSTGIYIDGDTADYANITNNTINLTYKTNCAFSDGECNGIHLASVDNSTIDENTVNVDMLGIVLFSDANNNSIQYNNVTAISGAIFLYISSNNTIVYNNATVSDSNAILLFNVNNNNIIQYNYLTAGDDSAVFLQNSNNNNIIQHNNLTAADKTICLISSSNNNLIYNNTINATGNGGDGFHTYDTGNRFVQNNITADVWVDDKEGGNFYNDSEGVGNIYYFSNGTASWDVYDIRTTSPPDWADSGSDVPLNATLAEWTGFGNDSHPYTENEASTHNAFINITNVSIYSSVGPYADGWIALNMTADTNETNTLIAYISAFKNGVNQTGLANSTVISNDTEQMVFNQSSDLVAGDIWNFTVYVTDGTNISGINITQGITVGLNCSELSTPNIQYNMIANANIDGLTCFNITAENVTLDCAGYSITGDNSSTTYGVYTNKFNTTVKNCNIKNFSSGLFISVVDSTYSNFYNNTINITYLGGYGVYAE